MSIASHFLKPNEAKWNNENWTPQLNTVAASVQDLELFVIVLLKDPRNKISDFLSLLTTTYNHMILLHSSQSMGLAKLPSLKCYVIQLVARCSKQDVWNYHNSIVQSFFALYSFQEIHSWQLYCTEMVQVCVHCQRSHGLRAWNFNYTCVPVISISQKCF